MEFKDNIIHRPDHFTEYEDALSLGHIVIENLTKAGDQIMLISGETGEQLTARELLSECIKIAKALTAAGVRQGDVVSIVSENRLEFVFVLIGTILLNCRFAPVNNSYSEREILHALTLSKPKIIFASAGESARVLKSVENLNFIEKVVLLDDERAADKRVVRMRDFTSGKLLESVKFEAGAVDTKKTVCFIMCSSGTTGLPKGVQITHHNVIVSMRHGIDNLLNKEQFGIDEVTVLGLLPLFHVFGASVMFFSMATALARVVLLDKFEERKFLKTIQDYKCNVLFAVPPLMVFLSKDEIVDEYDLSSLRMILSGAAPLSKEVEDSVRNRLNNPHLIMKQGYGMTELTVGGLATKGIYKSGSVGDVNAGVSLKVIDANGKALGPYERGELCFKGTIVMLGYIDNEKATNEMIDKDGWLHTGDVGYYDEDLQLFIVDRIKELIKYKGFQVPPAELEALLLTNEKIKDCGVIGKPDDVAGELPLAFVVKDDPSLTEAEVLKFVADRASSAKRLRGGVIFLDEIPKNPSGKILRRELRDLLKLYETKSKL